MQFEEGAQCLAVAARLNLLVQKRGDITFWAYPFHAHLLRVLVLAHLDSMLFHLLLKCVLFSGGQTVLAARACRCVDNILVAASERVNTHP